MARMLIPCRCSSFSSCTPLPLNRFQNLLPLATSRRGENSTGTAGVFASALTDGEGRAKTTGTTQRGGQNVDLETKRPWRRLQKGVKENAPSAVACWHFKPFSPAARWTRLFRGGAGCTRLERTPLGVHIALGAHPSLVPIAVSFQVLDSSAVGNSSRQIVQCVQGSRFAPSRRSLGHYQDAWISPLNSSNKLSTCCSDAHIAQHVQNGSGRRPECTCHAWKRRIPTLRTWAKGTQPLLRGGSNPTERRGPDSTERRGNMRSRLTVLRPEYILSYFHSLKRCTGRLFTRLF
jgi:hypothetical protein